MTCGTCNGSGTILDRIRVAGEAFDADQYEAECHECGGTGEISDREALIAGILEWGAERRLTEQRGDPFLNKQRAA